MEATKWLKPSISVSRIGDSASVQAVTRVNQHRPARPLCLLRRRRNLRKSRKGLQGRGALLAQNAVQPQLGRPMPHLGRLQPNQRTDTVAET